MPSQSAYLRIVDVVDFVKDDKFYISDQVGSLVQHTPQDLGRHLLISSVLFCFGVIELTIRQLPSALICTSPVKIPTDEGSKLVLKSRNF
jgi:hypothetical protein